MIEDKNSSKKYEAPVLHKWGTVADLTQNNLGLGALDNIDGSPGNSNGGNPVFGD